MIKRKATATIHNLSGVFVGRITQTRAKQIGCKCADIFLTKNYVRHIKLVHSKELDALGITVENYVRMIVEHYNEVREGTHNSILLVVRQTGRTTHDAAAIRLFYDKPHDWWEIKTAEPRSTADLDKRKLLWKKSQPPK